MSFFSFFPPQWFNPGYIAGFIEKIVMKLIWRTPAALLHYDRFFILRYDFDVPAVRARRLKSIRTRTAGISDIPALNKFLDKKERYVNRFVRGDIAIVAELRDEIVGMEWIEITRQHYEEENEYWFPLPERSVWTYDGHVSPAYRVKGVWASITDEVLRLLHERAFHSLYCMVQGLNRHALNAHLRYGYRLIRQVIFIRFLFLRIYLEKNLEKTAESNAWQPVFAVRKLRWYKGSLRT